VHLPSRSNTSPLYTCHWSHPFYYCFLYSLCFELHCNRRPVGQFVLVSGSFWSRWPDFKSLWMIITFFLLQVGRPLWREDGSVICSAITHWLESYRTHNHTLLSHLRLPQPGELGPHIHIPRNRAAQLHLQALGLLVLWSSSSSYITSDGQSASSSLCFKLKSNLYYDRRPVGQSVLVSGTHLAPTNNFSPYLFKYFRQLLVCWCGEPSLTRSLVCRFHFLLGIANATFLSSKSHGTHEHILLSLFLRLPQPGGPGSCIYLPQELGSPVTLRNWVNNINKPLHSNRQLQDTIHAGDSNTCKCRLC
jgi:hypothetical protein